jgi:hypothetical protein
MDYLMLLLTDNFTNGIIFGVTIAVMLGLYFIYKKNR